LPALPCRLETWSFRLPPGGKVENCFDAGVVVEQVVETHDARDFWFVMVVSAEQLPISICARHEQDWSRLLEDVRADERHRLPAHGFHSSGVCAPFDRLQVRHDGARFSGEVGPPFE